MSTTHTTTTDSTQHDTSAPPAYTAPGLAQDAALVTNALGQVPTSHYSGQQVAFMTPQQLAAIQHAYTQTAGQAGQETAWMQQQLPTLSHLWNYQSQLPTQSFNMGSMADVNPVIDAALRPVYEQLTQQILPGIKSSALDAGAYSNDRAMSTMPLEALNQYSRNAQDTAAQIGYQNYNDYQNRAASTFEQDQNRLLGDYNAETARGTGQEAAQSGMMGSINDYVTGILHNSASVGDLLRMSSELGVSNQQSQIDNALAQDKYASYSPFMGLDQAANILSTLSGNYGTQDSSGHQTQKQTDSGLGEILKMGMGLASMAMGIPGIGPAMGLGGAAAGAGGIASTFSGMNSPGIMLGSQIFGGG